MCVFRAFLWPVLLLYAVRCACMFFCAPLQSLLSVAIFSQPYCILYFFMSACSLKCRRCARYIRYMWPSILVRRSHCATRRSHWCDLCTPTGCSPLVALWPETEKTLFCFVLVALLLLSYDIIHTSIVFLWTVVLCRDTGRRRTSYVFTRRARLKGFAGGTRRRCPLCFFCSFVFGDQLQQT